MKTKLMSRQASQVAAGVKESNTDFHTLDEVDNNCAKINDASIKWAKSFASEKTLKRYEELGDQMVTGYDLDTFNEANWITTKMNYQTDEATGTVIVQSPTMRTSLNDQDEATRGFHYCKVLSPFRVMEWMYVDSLIRRDGINDDSVGESVNQAIDHFYDFADRSLDLIGKVTEEIFLN